MIVNKTIPYPPEHSVEIGKASWDSSVNSIRRRKNNQNSTFDPFSSSEIPIDDPSIDLNISDLICVCLKNDLLNNTEMSKIINELLESMKRQRLRISIP